MWVLHSFSQNRRKAEYFSCCLALPPSLQSWKLGDLHKYFYGWSYRASIWLLWLNWHFHTRRDLRTFRSWRKSDKKLFSLLGCIFRRNFPDWCLHEDFKWSCLVFQVFFWWHQLVWSNSEGQWVFTFTSFSKHSLFYSCFWTHYHLYHRLLNLYRCLILVCCFQIKLN